MKYRDWLIILFVTSVIMAISNLIGYQVSIVESVPGIAILCGIALFGLFLSRIIPVKLPMIMYVTTLGLILASPISPISDIVLYYTNKISFMAPVTVVGAITGISIGKDYAEFKKVGWKFLVVGLIVIAGTYIGSAIVAHIVLSITGRI